jgi:hypothetical protein
MSAKSKETPTVKQAEEEEEYGLVYNMWIDGGVNITMAENSTIIFQTGKPKDPPPPGNP